MRKGAFILSILFMVLTFIGAGYVLLNHGQVSAGYAAVPMVMTCAFLSIYRGGKKKEEE